ncbi:MAG: hypothetical protein AAFX58_15785, partial [Pseudomonadota bacterium]
MHIHAGDLETRQAAGLGIDRTGLIECDAEFVGVEAPISIRINPDVDARTHEKITTGRKADKFGIGGRHRRRVFLRRVGNTQSAA